MKKKVSKKSKRRLMLFGVLSIVSIGYFFVTFFAYTYSYFSLKNEEKNLNEELNSLETKKTNLKIEIEKLNDPDYIARYAKENYLYSGNGEYVLKLDDNKQINNTKNDNNQIIYILIALSFIIFLAVVNNLIHKKNPK